MAPLGLYRTPFMPNWKDPEASVLGSKRVNEMKLKCLSPCFSKITSSSEIEVKSSLHTHAKLYIYSLRIIQKILALVIYRVYGNS